MNRPSHEHMPLGLALERVAAEVKAIGILSVAVEDDVLNWINGTSSNTITPIPLQRFDLLVQSIFEISSLIEKLSKSADPEVEIDFQTMVSDVKLAGIRTRLLDSSCEIQQLKNEIDLF